MGIRERLWRVLEREGYGSVEEMARRESMKHNIEIPAGTLYSWMTRRQQHRRRPWSPSSLHVISLITGTPAGELFEQMVKDDAHATSAAR